MDKDILFIPDVSSGSGHLLRSLRLQSRLGGRIALYTSTQHRHKNKAYRPAINAELLSARLPYITLLKPGDTVHTDVAIFDYRSLDTKYLAQVNAGLTIGLDLGGKAREHVSYLIDTLPNFLSRPNITDYGFLEPATEVRPDWPNTIKSVLIVFGGSDTEHRAESLAQAIRDASNLEVHAYSGVFSSQKDFITEDYIMQALRNADSFRNSLKNYDLIITHAGMLAFEALWSKVAVLMLNPEHYHERLCKLVGLPFISGAVGTKFRGREKRLASNILEYIKQDAIISQCQKVRPATHHDLANYIDTCIQHYQGVGIKNTIRDTLLARFPLDTYFQSKLWDIGYLETIRQHKIQYTEDYFFQEYKNQYGKTYLEDADTIRLLSSKRLAHIKRLAPPSNTLLDLGCAYGIFLQEAKEAGFAVEGVDISSKAVEYINVELGLSAQCHDVQSSTLPSLFQGRTFGVVSMWYVLEHCHDVIGLLSSIRTCMMPGAILALALPNTTGISARKNKMKFLQESPADHYHLFSHTRLRKIFHAMGFQLCKKVSTGHHPERFPYAQLLLQPVFMQISHVLSLGDTFEAYFRYTGESQ